MKLELEFRRYSLDLLKPMRTAHGLIAQREGILVRLSDDSGLAGYGEAAPLTGFGRETVDEDEALLAGFAGVVDEAQIHAMSASAECVQSALTQAMIHLSSQRAPAAGVGSPFSESASSTDAWPVAALLPAGRAALTEVDGRLELGYRVFKWKVGVGEVADELGLLDDLLARLPSGARLRLDANGAWDRRRAERWLERCADRPIEHVEQPIAPEAKGSFDLLNGLSQDYPTPIALDESLVGAVDLKRWLGAGWSGVYVIKPTLLGRAQEQLDLLAAASAKVVFSSALETGVGARAALRHAFAWKGSRRALGFGVWPLFVDRRFDGPFQAPFLRASDVDRLSPESVWTALT